LDPVISLRQATDTDTGFLAEFDLAPPMASELNSAVDGGKMQVVMAGARLVGFLSSTSLWGKLPFLELFEICEAERGHGYGKAAVRAWEEQMRVRGFDLVLVSTHASGDAQHFWRKMGYVDCGALMVRSKPAEVFFQRAL